MCETKVAKLASSPRGAAKSHLKMPHILAVTLGVSLINFISSHLTHGRYEAHGGHPGAHGGHQRPPSRPRGQRRPLAVAPLEPLGAGAGEPRGEVRAGAAWGWGHDRVNLINEIKYNY